MTNFLDTAVKGDRDALEIIQSGKKYLTFNQPITSKIRLTNFFNLSLSKLGLSITRYKVRR